MDTTIISCKTIETELLAAMQNTGVNYPVIWLESGLHNTPDKLRAELIRIIQSIGRGRVLLAMGACGNALVDLCADGVELIVPRVDDCITLLLGSMHRRHEISKELSAYFLTNGWMRGERNLWIEHQYTVKKYGKRRAMGIAKALYGHYRTLALLDSGTSPIEPLVKETEIIAETFSLKQKILPATLTYLEALLTGPWESDRFIIKKAGSVISVSDFTGTFPPQNKKGLP